MLQLQPSLISSSNFFGSTFSENLFGTRFKQGYDIHIHAVPPKRRCDVNRSASKKNGERSSFGTPPHSLNFRKKSRRNIIADTSIHKECYQNTKKKSTHNWASRPSLSQLQWIQTRPFTLAPGQYNTCLLPINDHKFHCYKQPFYHLTTFREKMLRRLPASGHKKFTTSASFKRSLRQDLEIGPSWVGRSVSLPTDPGRSVAF